MLGEGALTIAISTSLSTENRAVHPVSPRHAPSLNLHPSVGERDATAVAASTSNGTLASSGSSADPTSASASFEARASGSRPPARVVRSAFDRSESRRDVLFGAREIDDVVGEQRSGSTPRRTKTEAGRVAGLVSSDSHLTLIRSASNGWLNSRSRKSKRCYKRIRLSYLALFQIVLDPLHTEDDGEYSQVNGHIDDRALVHR